MREKSPAERLCDKYETAALADAMQNARYQRLKQTITTFAARSEFFEATPLHDLKALALFYVKKWERARSIKSRAAWASAEDAFNNDWLSWVRSNPFASQGKNTGDTGLMENFAKRLLDLTKDCRGSMHEPDEQGFNRVRLIGDHLDNAFGDNITVDATLNNYQEYVLIICKDEVNGSCGTNVPFNLATLIALARIGAEQILKDA